MIFKDLVVQLQNRWSTLNYTKMADFKDYFAVNKRIDIQVRFMGFTCSIVIAKTLSRCFLVV